MSNDLTIFDKPQMSVPDYLDDIFGDDANIAPRDKVPSLSYEGKVWTISAHGEKTRLVKLDEEGDEVPVAVLPVFVLDFNERRGRAYYPGAYNPDQPGTPICWSDDGVAPDPTIEAPQHHKCDGCPMAEKGSKTTEDGRKVTACSQHRMLAVVPAKKIDHVPLRMKIAVTSDFDKQSPELAAKGWMAFQQYRDWLISKNIKHTARVVTKMRFDPNVAYPKVLFNPSRWTEPDEARALAPVIKSEEVQKILQGTWTVNGVDGEHRTPDDAAEKAAAEKAEAEKAAAEKKAKAAAEKAEAEKAAAEKKAKAEKAAAEKKAKAEAEKAAAEKKAQAETATSLDDDDDGDLDALLGGADSGTVDEPPAATEGTPSDVDALLAEWGEDD